MTEEEFQARAIAIWWYGPGCGHVNCSSYANFKKCFRCGYRQNDLPEEIYID